MIKRNLSLLAAAALFTGGVLGACSSDENGSTSNSNGTPDSGSTPDASTDAKETPDTSSVIDVNSPDTPHDITIEPSAPVVTVKTGEPLPSVTFEALVDGEPVTALWLIDRGEIGQIDTHTGEFSQRARLRVSQT